MPAKTFQGTLKTLRKQYADELPDKIKAIAANWQALQAKWHIDLLQELQRQVHTIAGDAGTFGFMSITETARSLNIFLQLLQERGTPATGVEQATISQQLLQLQQDVASPPDESPKASAAVVSTDNSSKSVYLLDDDKTFAEYLALQLEQRGYTVRIFNTVKGLPDAVSQNPPEALISDIMLAEGELAGPQLMFKIQKNQSKVFPMIFISTRTDMRARLAAVRANGDAYFTKPFDTNALADKLDLLTRQEESDTAYRILIVDDSGHYAENYAKILRQAGMQVYILNTPMHFMEALDKCSPILVLINTQLSGVNGLEMAIIMRQQEKYAHLPIVFFAQRFDQTIRRAAMRGVSDDFLSESVSPEQLLAIIVNRIKKAEQREEQIQQISSRDPATGLYNRQYMLMQLELGYMLNEATLAVLYVHLDNFQGIEKILGAIASDAVLRATARFLQEQTTQRDLLARFSDSVFVIISDSRPLDKVRTLAALIRATMEHHIVEVVGQQAITTCTIGVGVHDSPTQALENAGLACQEALKEGGNRINFHKSAKAIKAEQQRQQYWEDNVRMSMENQNFFLAYQPIANLHGRPEAYYDVLVRLRSMADNEIILPADFLPVAERSGLIVHLDRWVVRHAISSMAEKKCNGQRVSFFVRLSRASLSDPSLFPLIEKLLIDEILYPGSFVLDVSQSVVNNSLKETQSLVSLTRGIGCRFALRDFDGSANAFQLLTLLDVDFVKIQGKIIRGAAKKPKNIALIQNIVDKVHAQDKLVIAPFVEDGESLNVLWQLKVDYIVGNFAQAPSEQMDYDFGGTQS